MNLIHDSVLSRGKLESMLKRNGAQVTSQGSSLVIYRFSSSARAEVTPAGNGQYRLRVLAPPGCACMK